MKDFGFGKNSMESSITEECLCFISHLQKLEKEEGVAGVEMRRQFNLPVINCLWMIIAGHRFPYDDSTFTTMLAMGHNYEYKIVRSGAILNTLPWLRFIAPDFTGYKAQIDASKYIEVSS